MKKKILSVALVLALLAVVVGSSLAYFTADDEVNNTFTIGSVDIEIYENDEETDYDTMEFTQALMPVVNTTNPSADVNYIPKVVEVKSTGLNPAYIRVHLAIPTVLEGYLVLDVDTENGWTQVGTGVITGDYTVYTYDYTSEVDPNGFTTELLKGVYLDSKVDLKDNTETTAEDLEFCIPNGDGTYTFSGFVAHTKTENGYTTNTVNVLVAAQAIQSQGFENGATNALNTGFGAGTNPWQ